MKHFSALILANFATDFQVNFSMNWQNGIACFIINTIQIPNLIFVSAKILSICQNNVDSDTVPNTIIFYI